jgi:hypothetical protein
MTVWDVWERHFGALPPVGHLLRQALPPLWMRIHSLPGSQRYAEGDLEYVELLSRHNQIAAEILGSDAEAILFIHAWGTVDAFRSSFIGSGKAKEVGLSEDRLFTRGFSSEGENLVVGGRRIQWSEHAWDILLRDVADWRLNSVVLLNPESGEVYAPYDGGADLFLKTLERVAELRQRWASWVSNHPSGL